MKKTRRYISIFLILAVFSISFYAKPKTIFQRIKSKFKPKKHEVTKTEDFRVVKPVIQKPKVLEPGEPEVIKTKDQKPAEFDGELVEKGERYVRSLYGKGSELIPRAGGDYLDSIVAIMHYFYSKVLENNQGQGFLSGTIVVEDEGWKLHTFLIDYVKREFGGDLCKEIWVTKYWAYPRRSTHFNNYYRMTKKAKKKWGIIKKLCDYVHYGIDLKEEQVLPIPEKRHILFGKLGIVNGIPWIFFKFEEAGLKGKKQFVEHTKGLITKKGPPTLKKKLRIGKKKPKEISPDSLIDFRREGVPVEFRKEYVKLIFSNESGLSKEEREESIKKAKAFGIREIAKQMGEFSKSGKAKKGWSEKAEGFANKLKKQYPDYPNRFGNEVILRKSVLVAIFR